MLNKKLKRIKSYLTKASDILPQVIENLGLENNLKVNAIKEIWPLVTSKTVAEKSFPAYFDRDMNLVVNVNNSVLTTELSMQKLKILQKIKEAIKTKNIVFKDIRFVTRTN